LCLLRSGRAACCAGSTTRSGFGRLIARLLTDSRKGKNTHFALAHPLRQSACSRLAGYEEVIDPERFSRDPTFRLIGSEKTCDRGAALTSRLQTFETVKLPEEEYFFSPTACWQRGSLGERYVNHKLPKVGAACFERLSGLAV
jgi:hypothetical protein